MLYEPRVPKSPLAPLDRDREFIVAQPVDEGEEEEVALLPPDCPSREQVALHLEPPDVTLPPPPAPERFQFSMFDMMVMTIGVAVGLAGGTWMPPEVFAAVLGLVTLVGLVLVHVNPPETHATRLAWGTLVMAYIIAVFAAVLRQW